MTAKGRAGVLGLQVRYQTDLEFGSDSSRPGLSGPKAYYLLLHIYYIYLPPPV